MPRQGSAREKDEQPPTNQKQRKTKEKDALLFDKISSVCPKKKKCQKETNNFNWLEKPYKQETLKVVEAQKRKNSNPKNLLWDWNF